MGIFSTIRSSRARTKAQVKAAKQRAKTEVKEEKKLALRRSRLLAKEKKNMEKSQLKNLKAKQKHEKRMAKQTYKQLKAGSFNAKNVKRYTGAARLLAPVVLPLIYRAVTWSREQLLKKKARNFGVSSSDLARFTGFGAPIKARIEAVRRSLDDAPLPAGLKKDITNRLDTLFTAADNAEHMDNDQRQRIHHSINSDLDHVTGQIHSRLDKDNLR
ncbi:DUF6474 family protein [Corynebacterium mendelii]|uniref:Uncharacterized protein n=1 Tax=Corynebacterium mendelii TaxID=2765362 RepID=A0A939E479_9CORY|nr:DUF6474 family protein [Corynebacterium mendelii]MBN9645327.1 hypothetical protein [Corynebacterium mendelii]